MKPAGFQFATPGWATPVLLVQRTMSPRVPPSATVKVVSHWRKLYFPASGPSFVGCQLLPPSTETSTLATPVSPPNAIPRARVGAPAGTTAPAPRVGTKERGTMALIGHVLNARSPALPL